MSGVPRRWRNLLPIILTVAWASRAIGVTAAAAPLAGQLISIGRMSLTIQARGGPGTVTTSSMTRYYQVTTASTHSLTLGETVGVSTARGSSTTAAPVTIAPSNGNLVVFVGTSRTLGNGGPGGGGGDDGGNGGGTEGDGGRSGVSGASGRITAISGASITIQPQGGAKATMTLNTATKLYRVASIVRSRLRTGYFVATRAALGAGAAASDVVEAAPGISLSIGASISGSIGG